MLTLMTVYLSTDMHWGDERAGVTVAVFTMLVTLFMLGVGSYAERFGLRRAILFALFLAFVGRILYSLAVGFGGTVWITVAVLGSVLVCLLYTSPSPRDS